jgi:hypothetical protein
MKLILIKRVYDEKSKRILGQDGDGKENGEEMRMGPLPNCDDFSTGRFAPLLKERVWG